MDSTEAIAAEILRFIRAEIDKAGLAIVPKEPTDEMVDAALRSTAVFPEYPQREEYTCVASWAEDADKYEEAARASWVRVRWRAMLAAMGIAR